MKIDFAKYSKLIKILTIIPVLVGLLTFAEAVIPEKTLDTEVVSKKSNFRLKTGNTTYTIQFKELDDQFTEEIYNSLIEGDKVTLKMSFFNEQISEVKRKKDNIVFSNDTSESLFMYLFAAAFLLCALVWFKSGTIKNSVAKYVCIAILISLIQGLRMM